MKSPQRALYLFTPQGLLNEYVSTSAEAVDIRFRFTEMEKKDLKYTNLKVKLIEF
jgi:hypothetical protein